MTDSVDVKARLFVQRALLDEVSPALRAVVLFIDGKALEINFYFDGDISSEDIESVSRVESEVLADYDDDFVVTANASRVDFPMIISCEGIWVYKRRE